MTFRRPTARSFPILGAILFVSGSLLPAPAGAQQPGKKEGAGAALFKTKCSACHTVGEGRRVGPDLFQILLRRDRAWVEKFITSSQTLIKSGDLKANAVFNYFDKTVMPDPPLKAGELNQIVDYLAESGTTASTPMVTGDADLGEALFVGREAFSEGGPACSSCHDVRNDAIISGGVLAMDLTDVFSRKSAQDLQGIVGRPPAPVMQRAYKGHPLDPDEVSAIVAYLQRSEGEDRLTLPLDNGIMLLAAGGAGALLMFLLFGLIWKGRRRQSVNAAIYARQVKSR